MECAEYPQEVEKEEDAATEEEKTEKTGKIQVSLNIIFKTHRPYSSIEFQKKYTRKANIE
ncbi:MAG: hypothetical protein OEW71_00230 [Candidatus Bathyarchaeota archaeon]|nr:hypothetical protein [Candidatus Bathyarchaeota archaeon]